MMVVAASAKKCSLIAHALLDLKPENACVKRDGPIKVGDFEVNMAYPRCGVDGPGFGLGICRGVRLHDCHLC